MSEKVIMQDSFYMDDFYTGDFLEEAKLMVKKLTLQCPKDRPFPGCPLSILHELPTDQKLELVDTLSLEQLENIVQHHARNHQNCLERGN